jgi:hypothetical protein
VAWARLGATCFRTGCLAVAARRLSGPRPEWWRLLGIGLLAAGCIVVSGVAAGLDGWTSFAARLAVVLTFPVLMLTTPLVAPVLRNRTR